MFCLPTKQSLNDRTRFEIKKDIKLSSSFIVVIHLSFVTKQKNRSHRGSVSQKPKRIRIGRMLQWKMGFARHDFQRARQVSAQMSLILSDLLPPTNIHFFPNTWCNCPLYTAIESRHWALSIAVESGQLHQVLTKFLRFCFTPFSRSAVAKILYQGLANHPFFLLAADNNTDRLATTPTTRDNLHPCCQLPLLDDCCPHGRIVVVGGGCGCWRRLQLLLSAAAAAVGAVVCGSCCCCCCWCCQWLLLLSNNNKHQRQQSTYYYNNNKHQRHLS